MQILSSRMTAYHIWHSRLTRRRLPRWRAPPTATPQEPRATTHPSRRASGTDSNILHRARASSEPARSSALGKAEPGARLCNQWIPAALPQLAGSRVWWHNLRWHCGRRSSIAAHYATGVGAGAEGGGIHPSRRCPASKLKRADSSC